MEEVDAATRQAVAFALALVGGEAATCCEWHRRRETHCATAVNECRLLYFGSSSKFESRLDWSQLKDGNSVSEKLCSRTTCLLFLPRSRNRGRSRPSRRPQTGALSRFESSSSYQLPTERWPAPAFFRGAENEFLEPAGGWLPGATCRWPSYGFRLGSLEGFAGRKTVGRTESHLSGRWRGRFFLVQAVLLPPPRVQRRLATTCCPLAASQEPLFGSPARASSLGRSEPSVARAGQQVAVGAADSLKARSRC